MKNLILKLFKTIFEVAFVLPLLILGTPLLVWVQASGQSNVLAERLLEHATTEPMKPIPAFVYALLISPIILLTALMGMALVAMLTKETK